MLFRQYPNSKNYLCYDPENEGVIRIIDSKHFPCREIYSQYYVETRTGKLQSQVEIMSKYLYGFYSYPARFNLNIESQIRPELLIPQLTSDELKAFQNYIDRCSETFCIETPWRINIYMMDGREYNKFFPTKELAIEELEVLKSKQPLDFFKDIKYNDFIPVI